MWLKKLTGGTAIGAYEWPEDGSVTEVPEQLGRELLAIPESGFEKVDGPEPVKEITEPGPTAEITEGDGGAETGKPEPADPEVAGPKRGTARKPAAQK
jgi:hypothetical protein